MWHRDMKWADATGKWYQQSCSMKGHHRPSICKKIQSAERSKRDVPVSHQGTAKNYLLKNIIRRKSSKGNKELPQGKKINEREENFKFWLVPSEREEITAIPTPPSATTASGWWSSYLFQEGAIPTLEFQSVQQATNKMRAQEDIFRHSVTWKDYHPWSLVAVRGDVIYTHIDAHV